MAKAQGASFESLRKEAKRWLRALRDGDLAALARLEKALPRHSRNVTLREVQQALARERGFESWARLKEELAESAADADRDALVTEFLERACIFSGSGPDFPDKYRRAERIRARHPEIAKATIHTAVLCGELEHVAGLLAREPSLVHEKGGVQRWQPLLFLCYGRLPHAPFVERALDMARLLLDAGADPNTWCRVGTEWPLRFDALTGVMGEGEMGQPPHPCADELARLLLDRGASPNPSQGLYNTHLVNDDPKWLELLIGYGLSKDDPVNWDLEPDGTEKALGKKPESMFSYLVAQAAHLGHMKRLRCLLDHGADPNATSNYTGKTCYQSALIAGRADVRDLLLEFGAAELPVEGKDAFAAACNRQDRDEAARLLDGHPEYLEDVQVLLDAAQRGAVPVVRLLLELGMDPNREGKHGHRALHQGVQHREVCELLWQHGADPASRCYGGTPCDWAFHAGDLESARFHAEKSRLLLDAVRSGHVTLAKELLDENRERIHERTPWGDTALHRLPADPDQAHALIELLLDRGADPGATNDEGKTAGEKLDATGLDTIADMLASAVEVRPEKAPFDTRG